MTYILDKNSFYAIVQRLKPHDKIVYKKHVPRRILNVFKEAGYSVEKVKMFPEGSTWYRSQFYKYPSRKDLEGVLDKKYYVDDENWVEVFNKIKPGEKIIYSERLKDTKILDTWFGGITKEYFPFNSPIKPPRETIFLAVPKESTPKFLGDQAAIIQYIKTPASDINKYRRHRLNDYLNEVYPYRVHTISNKIQTHDLALPGVKAVIISDPRDSHSLIKAYKDRCEIIYERSDNWDGLKEGDQPEQYVIANADKIICSSQWLYDDTIKRRGSDTNVYLIENGCEVRPYGETEKYPKKTAIYIGRNYNKVDVQLLEFLAQQNPDWDIVTYGIDIQSQFLKVFEGIPEKEIWPIITKCHLGLIPFTKSEWTKGMLPLKELVYLNAHLPVLYTNCRINIDKFPNTTEYNPEITDLDYYIKPVEDFDFTKYSWPYVTKQIKEIALKNVPDLITSKIQEIDYRQRVKGDYVTVVSWKMTEWCNYRCSYCCENSKEDFRDTPLDPKQILQVAKSIDNLIGKIGGPVKLSLIGGEVSYVDLPEVLSYIKSPNLRHLGVITNLSNKVEVYKDLEKYCESRNLSFTITSSLHIEFAKPEEFLSKILALKPSSVTLKVVIDDKNFQFYKEFISRLPEDYKISISAKRDVQDRISDQSEELRNWVNEIRNRKACIETNKPMKVTLKDGSVRYFKDNSEFLENHLDKVFIPFGFYCSAGIDWIKVLPNGDVEGFPCETYKGFKYGNVIRNDVKLPSSYTPCLRRSSCPICPKVFLRRIN